MGQKSVHTGSSSERIVKNLGRATRKQYSVEEKSRIVAEQTFQARRFPIVFLDEATRIHI
jgi:hypothetical protein